MRGRVLIVEDRESLRRMLERALAGEGYEVAAAATGGDGVRAARERPFDLVLTDLKLPDLSGLEVLAASRAAQPRVPVVVLTGYGTVAAAVEAMKLGAYDFLEKPVELDDLLRLVEGAIGQPEAAAAFAPPGAPPIVGAHPRLRAALRLLQRVAPTESTVLLTGESGTGKELFARALHALSPRRGGPFVAVNCAAIPETLDRERALRPREGGLHRRRPPPAGALRAGAGRDAAARRDRRAAAGGAGQGAARPRGAHLRARGERADPARRRAAGGGHQPRPAGDGRGRGRSAPTSTSGSPSSPSSCRRCASERATCRCWPATSSPRSPAATTASRRALDDEAAALLAAQAWPGNVRELANLLERAAILGEGPALRAADLRPLLEPLGGERERLRRALVEADGDKRRAAELLGISYRTLLQQVRAHDLEGVPRYREG